MFVICAFYVLGFLLVVLLLVAGFVLLLVAFDLLWTLVYVVLTLVSRFVCMFGWVCFGWFGVVYCLV